MWDTVRESLDTVGSLKFPMVLVGVQKFMSLGSLTQHEILRDHHRAKDSDLMFVDNFEDLEDLLSEIRIIFLSHQWLGWRVPDSRKVQYNCACLGVQQLIEQLDWPLDNTFVWVDYSSIPQRCTAVQMLAITSLPIYSSMVSAFIVVAPASIHDDTHLPCDLKSYSSRAWCRAEVLSHALTKGIKKMYYASEDGLVHCDMDGMMRDAMFVFEGELTCCRMKHAESDICDRQHLVVPFLGLYSFVVHSLAMNKDLQMEESTLEFFNQIIANRDRIFPATFKYVTAAGVSDRKLFEGLLDRMDESVKKAGAMCFKDFRVKHKSSANENSSRTGSVGAAHALFHGTSSEDPQERFSAHYVSEGGENLGIEIPRHLDSPLESATHVAL